MRLASRSCIRRGPMLTFDEATHTYTLDGIQLPSVTEVTRFCAYDYKSDRP